MVTRVGMFLVALMVLGVISYTTGVPYSALKVGPLPWIASILLVGMAIVSSAISRKHPASPIALWAAYEVTWLSFCIHLQGAGEGFSAALIGSRFPAIYFALALSNWALVRKSNAH
jgi:hypothetical protein